MNRLSSTHPLSIPATTPSCSLERDLEMLNARFLDPWPEEVEFGGELEEDIKGQRALEDYVIPPDGEDPGVEAHLWRGEKRERREGEKREGREKSEGRGVGEAREGAREERMRISLG